MTSVGDSYEGEIIGNPHRRVLLWDPYEDPYEGAMRFRLTWDGPLIGPSSNKRSAHKHKIRMHFHSQLKTLWEKHPTLAGLREKEFPDYKTAVSGKQGGPFRVPTKPYIDLVTDEHRAHGHKWMPIVLKDTALTCSISMLYLRRGQIGHVLNVGDIDGRLKILFDALAIPVDGAGATEPEDPESPTFVLLQDDSLVSHISVETDELLHRTGEHEVRNDSKVILTIDVRMTSANWLSLGFAGY